MQPNDTIDDYQIYEDLGRGGFATVKRAVRKRDNMEVAIKMVSCLAFGPLGPSIDHLREREAVS